MAGAKRTNVRPIPGMAAPGSRPAGSSAQLPAATATSTRNPGPNLRRQGQNTAGGPGVTVNSQPVNGG